MFSPTQSAYNLPFVRFKVFTAVTLKNVAFWDVSPRGSCKNLCFRGTYHVHHQGEKKLCGSLHADDGGDTFSEMSALTRATWRNILEDGILESLRFAHTWENYRQCVLHIRQT
jgi:hypothetical protein